MTTLEILKRVRRILARPEHWTKHVLSDDRGAYCILGAINVATTGRYWHSYLTKGNQDKVSHALRLKNTSKLVHWNNSPDTTHRKLLARIDKAIARCSSRYGHRPIG